MLNIAIVGTGNIAPSHVEGLLTFPQRCKIVALCDIYPEKAQAMKVLLEETSSLPVILWDERRTTIDAHQILLNNGKNAKKRKKVVDAVAASLILEGYLTYKKSHPAG